MTTTTHRLTAIATIALSLTTACAHTRLARPACGPGTQWSCEQLDAMQAQQEALEQARDAAIAVAVVGGVVGILASRPRTVVQEAPAYVPVIAPRAPTPLAPIYLPATPMPALRPNITCVTIGNMVQCN